jgi:membrane protease YdiL (CAAX protease family)
VLGVWLVFPAASLLLGDPQTTRIAGSLAALALLLGVRRPRVPRVRLTSLAVFGGSTALGVAVALLAGGGLGRPGLAPRSIGAGGLAHGLAIVAIAPIFEELLYRERLLGVLRDLWGRLPALLLSSAVFAFAHMDARVLPVAFAGGLVCGAVMLRTGSLAAVIGLHAGWNLGVLGAA